jgi:hypothetical protein
VDAVGRAAKVLRMVDRIDSPRMTNPEHGPGISASK